MTEQAADTIAFLSSLFRQARRAAQAILRDERIAGQWTEVDIDRYRPTLTVLGIDHGPLGTAAQNIDKNARAILRDIIKWENRLSNLEADIRLNNRPSGDTTAEALHLKRDCGELAQQLDTLRRQHVLLSGAAKTVREHLAMEKLLALATALEDISKKGKELFDKGLQIFRLVTDEPALMADTGNIHRLGKKAEKLEADLTKIEFPKLPELARIVLRCQLDICHAAVNEMLLHVGAINRVLLPEIKKIKVIKDNLGQGEGASLSETLTRIEGNARRLRGVISEFEYKFHIIKDARTMSILLDNLTVFIEAFRDAYLPHIHAKIHQAGSPLDPRRLADETGKVYFNGFKGLLRLLKLLLAGGGKCGPLNEQTVADKISVALTTCPYYYCKDKKQAALIDDFIDSLLVGCAKPFPHGDLRQLLRDAIATYGSRIENDFSSFTTVTRTDTPDDTSGTAPPASPPGAQLGRLINKIEVRALQLTNLR